MTEQDKTKRSALCKLREYVEFRIKEFRNGKLPLKSFKFEPIDGFFSTEELKEIQRITDRIQAEEGLIQYCFFNGIDLQGLIDEERLWN